MKKFTGNLFYNAAKQLGGYAAKNKKKYCCDLFGIPAFTLSEVLITLAIVGVVSALTLPSVIQNIQDKQFRNKFKKAYSAFSQAILMIKNEDGEIVRGNTVGEIADIYCKIVKQMKTVGMVKQNCELNVSKVKWHDDLNWFTKDGRAFDLSGNSTYKMRYVFQTADNALYFYSCTNGTIIVDVNGHKKPNVVGRDIYYFTLTSNGNLNVKPITVPQCYDKKAPRWAISTTNYKTDCLTGTGWGCSVMTINNEL